MIYFRYKEQYQIVWATFIRISNSMDKISKFGGKCHLRFFKAVKITFLKKIVKI
jgi:hypothetical protein